jgi:O-antigen ligase
MATSHEPGAITRVKRTLQPARAPLQGAFFWLALFYFVYCARPEDWIPGLKYIPLAKVAALGAIVSLIVSAGATTRRIRDLPREGRYLIALVCFLVPASFLSPVWKGGALVRSLDFSKVAVAWVLTFLLVSNFQRLRQILFIQAGSVAVIAIVSIIKGHNTPRLQGVLGGIYDNSNDFAFALVISLPFCFAFLLQGRSLVRKLSWAFCSIAMVVALFLTASRSGFIDLVVAGSVCLWHFGVKGKRPALLIASFLIGLLIFVSAGGLLKDRFLATTGDVNNDVQQRALGSYEERRTLMIKSLEALEYYPLYGIGVRNFMTYSGIWKEVHNSYLQIAAEGGIPAIVLYLLFFWQGFANLRLLRNRNDLEPRVVLFVGALHSSLVGFAVGAMFSPEAYHYFPYFAVAQTSAILAIVKEKGTATVPAKPMKSRSNWQDWLSSLEHPSVDPPFPSPGVFLPRQTPSIVQPSID